MTLPPIIERELRVTARRGGTYWSRMGAAAMAGAIFLWVMGAQLTASRPAAAGLFTFRLLAAVAAVSVLGTAVRWSAESFAREKREETLGLMFLTPLRPLELVLGKLLSGSIVAFSRFVAMIPVLALPMLVGGVRLLDFTALVLALANLVFFASAVGLHVSARVWDERRAVTAATVTLLGLGALLPFLLLWLVGVIFSWPVAVTVLGISPAYPVYAALGAGSGSNLTFWGSLAVTQIIAWLFVRATSRLLPVCWKQRPEAGSSRLPVLPPLLQGGPAAQAGDPASRQIPSPLACAPAQKGRRPVRQNLSSQARTQMLDRNPVLWLALRWRADSTAAWIVASLALGATAVLGITGNWLVILTPGFGLFACLSLNLAVRVHVAAQAAQAFSRERREDTLFLLLGTPLQPRDLIEGHLHAVRQHSAAQLRTIVTGECVWMAVVLLGEAVQHGISEAFTTAMVSVAVIGLLVPDLHALGWVALWKGLTSHTAREASQGAVGAVVVLPAALAGVLSIGVGLMDWPIPPMVVFVAAWIGLGLLIGWRMAEYARRQLHLGLADWALRRSSGDPMQYVGWQKWGRRLGRWWGTRRRRFRMDSRTR